MSPASLVAGATVVGVAAPALFLALVAGASLVSRPLSERATGALSALCFSLAAAGLATAATALELAPVPRVVVDLGDWFRAGHYAFSFSLLADRLSLWFGLFAASLCGVVGRFAHSYLHRERGFNRFFAMLGVFATGILLVVLAGSIELALAGWELVGASSALLVAFFHERPLPVRNGLRVFAVYRITDVGLLLAAVLVHHAAGSGEFSALLGSAPWPAGESALPSGVATAVALCIAFSALGKCAQVPLSGWLPRAMEGPTPSSAIFYGALSVQAGAFLLLRVGPLLERAPLASALLVAVGLATALLATLVGRVQSDVKSALAYASLTQVSLILAEIGLGLRWIPLLHLLGHASVRSLQFLRAPSLLHDLHGVEAAVGGRLARTGPRLAGRLGAELERRLYRFALERAHLDATLDAWVVAPFLALFRRLDALERRWCAWLAGRAAPEEARRDA